MKTSLESKKATAKSDTQLNRVDIAISVVEYYKKCQKDLAKTIDFANKKFGLCEDTIKFLVEKYG